MSRYVRRINYDFTIYIFLTNIDFTNQVAISTWLRA